MNRSSTPLIVCCLAAALAAPAALYGAVAPAAGPPSGASAPAALPAAEARQVERLLREAKDLYEKGQLAETIDRLTVASVLFPAADVLYNLAVAHEDAGNLQHALSLYDRCLASAPIDVVRERAEDRRASLKRRLATGHLTLFVRPSGAEVTVDGAMQGKAPLAPLTLPVGRHHVRVTFPGYHPYDVDVDISATRDFAFVAELRPLTDAPASASPAADCVAAVQAAPRAPHSVGPWHWVTLGTGLALVAAGGTLVGLGNADFADVRGAEAYIPGSQPDGMPRERAQDLLDAGERKHLAGSVLLATGGTVLAASTLLFVLEYAVFNEKTPQLAVQPVTLPGGAGVLVQLPGGF